MEKLETCQPHPSESTEHPPVPVPSACPHCQHHPCSTQSSGGHIPWHRDLSHPRNECWTWCPSRPCREPWAGPGADPPLSSHGSRGTGMCPTAPTSSQDHPLRGGCGWASPGLSDALAQCELPVSLRILRVFCLAWSFLWLESFWPCVLGRALSSALRDVQSRLSQLPMCKTPTEELRTPQRCFNEDITIPTSQ